LPKRNYGFEKRQKEQRRQQNKEEKRLKKLERSKVSGEPERDQLKHLNTLPPPAPKIGE
jgi:hypothetical protein